METNQPDLKLFDENQSFLLIKEMIEVSQKKLKNNGILFILWGWLMFYNYSSGYIFTKVVMTYRLNKLFGYFGLVIGILAAGYTLYYIYRQHSKVQTYIGISLRYVWISLVGCLVITSLIIHNVMKVSNLELQHPIFMMFIAFATVITGGILRYKLIITGGILFGVLAYASSYFRLPEQMLFEAVAWLVAFIIPGHLLFARRKK